MAQTSALPTTLPACGRNSISHDHRIASGRGCCSADSPTSPAPAPLPDRKPGIRGTSDRAPARRRPPPSPHHGVDEVLRHAPATGSPTRSPPPGSQSPPDGFHIPTKGSCRLDVWRMRTISNTGDIAASPFGTLFLIGADLGQPENDPGRALPSPTGLEKPFLRYGDTGLVVAILRGFILCAAPRFTPFRESPPETVIVSSSSGDDRLAGIAAQPVPEVDAPRDVAALPCSSGSSRSSFSRCCTGDDCAGGRRWRAVTRDAPQSATWTPPVRHPHRPGNALDAARPRTWVRCLAQRHRGPLDRDARQRSGSDLSPCPSVAWSGGMVSPGPAPAAWTASATGGARD